MANISVDQMADTILDILKEYKDTLEEDITEAIDETSKEAVKELKSTSPKGRRGEYKKSWKRKKEKYKNGFYRNTIYSNEYRLTHLLENGHALKCGGRTVGQTSAYPHIKDAELNAIERLETTITRKIQEVSK